MMQSHQPITYCVPLDEVESNYFPAAAASYTCPSFDEVLQIDQDFYDVIDALAEFDDNDFPFDMNPSTVALPVCEEDCCPELIPTVSSFCVPRVNTAAVKTTARATPTATATVALNDGSCALEIVPAVPVCAAEECKDDDFCSATLLEYSHDSANEKLVNGLSTIEKKERRDAAVKRWKQKRHVQQYFLSKKRKALSSKTKRSLKNCDLLAANKIGSCSLVQNAKVVHGHETDEELKKAILMDERMTDYLDTALPSTAAIAQLKPSSEQLLLDHPECWNFSECTKAQNSAPAAPVSTTARIVHSSSEDVSIPTAISARQLATANRERERGKFKRTKTKWIPVTALYGGTGMQD